MSHTIKLKEAKVYKMRQTACFSNFLVPTYTRHNVDRSISDIQVFINNYRARVAKYFNVYDKKPFRSFATPKYAEDSTDWLRENDEKFFQHTRNEVFAVDHYLSNHGYISCMEYNQDGSEIFVGHSTGLMQMRHGSTGTVLATLRNIQFPPKPVYAIEYSITEPNVCYATSADGTVYRVEIPHVDTSVTDPPEFCIRADPMLDSLHTQFHGSPGLISCATPFVFQRTPALCLALLKENNKMVVGYADSAVKIYDMETQKVDVSYHVHKLRLQFIPKKLQRCHTKAVVAMRAHPEKPNVFVSGAWDNTLRVWDTRCNVGCMTTFEGVDICSDSIDVNRDQCMVGSWQTTEALTLWDLTAKKKVAVVRVQNRRPDIDGEYIYACRYWRSTEYNRKGKYGIIGGSGTNCLEVINLHNRYITCSYPTKGSVLAITSYQERIAFGGTSSQFTIVQFHDPKHEKDAYHTMDDSDHELCYIKPENYTPSFMDTTLRDPVSETVLSIYPDQDN